MLARLMDEKGKARPGEDGAGAEPDRTGELGCGLSSLREGEGSGLCGEAGRMEMALWERPAGLGERERDGPVKVDGLRTGGVIAG